MTTPPISHPHLPLTPLIDSINAVEHAKHKVQSLFVTMMYDSGFAHPITGNSINPLASILLKCISTLDFVEQRLLFLNSFPIDLSTSN